MDFVEYTTYAPMALTFICLGIVGIAIAAFLAVHYDSIFAVVVFAVLFVFVITSAACMRDPMVEVMEVKYNVSVEVTNGKPVTAVLDNLDGPEVYVCGIVPQEKIPTFSLRPVHVTMNMDCARAETSDDNTKIELPKRK